MPGLLFGSLELVRRCYALDLVFPETHLYVHGFTAGFACIHKICLMRLDKRTYIVVFLLKRMCFVLSTNAHTHSEHN